MWGWQWHKLDHMQTICTSLQTDNHANTSSLNFTDWMLFLMPNRQLKVVVVVVLTVVEIRINVNNSNTTKKHKINVR